MNNITTTITSNVSFDDNTADTTVVAAAPPPPPPTAADSLVGLRRIDENALNRLLDSVPHNLVDNLIRRKLPDPSKERRRTANRGNKLPQVPAIVGRAVRTLGLLDVDDVEIRARLFIGYLKTKNLSYNTVMRYFSIVRSNGLFTRADNTVASIRPDPTAFVGRMHSRVIAMRDYVTLYNYLTKFWSEFTAPVLVAFHTGLRSMEILQFTSFTLYQLRTRQVYVNIKRKQTLVTYEPPFWRPVYSNDLMQFVDKLIDLYADNYAAYLEHSTNTPIFPITTETLVSRIRLAYAEALGSVAPRGFGIHTCRYMMAQMMASTSKNLVAIQAFLQHRSLKTTQRYLRSDFQYTIDKFNEITRGPYAKIYENLKPPPLAEPATAAVDNDDATTTNASSDKDQ